MYVFFLSVISSEMPLSDNKKNLGFRYFMKQISEQGHCCKGFSVFCMCKHIEIFALNCFAL